MRRWWSVACGALLLAGTAFAQSPTGIFAPAATPAHSIFSLSMLVLAVTLGIFLVVAGMLLTRWSASAIAPEIRIDEPPQIYGSNQIELSWTVIPILIVVMLFLTTTRVILGTAGDPQARRRVERDRDRPSVLVGVSAIPSWASSRPTNCTSRSAIPRIPRPPT